MPRVCSVCSNPALAEIAKNIARHGSNREIAARFNLTPSAVQRHRANCLQTRKRPNRDVQGSARSTTTKKIRFASDDAGRCNACGQLTDDGGETLEPMAIVKRAERILYVSETIALNAQDDNDSRLALLAVDRCQRSIDTLAKIAGLIRQDSVVIDNRQQNLYASWQTASLEALDTFHEALANGATVEQAIRALTKEKTRASLGAGDDEIPALPLNAT